MKEYFELNRKEKRQEWLLLSACILLFLILIKGVYNQEHNIDQDNILIPLFFLFGGIFFLTYGMNGLRKGNLTPKWTPFLLFQIAMFLTKRLTSLTDENTREFVKKIMGILGLIIGTGLLIIAIFSLMK